MYWCVCTNTTCKWQTCVKQQTQCYRILVPVAAACNTVFPWGSLASHQYFILSLLHSTWSNCSCHSSWWMFYTCEWVQFVQSGVYLQVRPYNIHISQTIRRNASVVEVDIHFESQVILHHYKWIGQCKEMGYLERWNLLVLTHLSSFLIEAKRCIYASIKTNHPWFR